MLILLPPSETKRDGGTGGPLDLATLSFPRLNSARRRAISRLVAVSRDETQAMIALKLGPKGAPDVARNRAVKTGPTLPAIERYTGVLFDALDARSLPPHAKRHATEWVVIHSALFGLVRGGDPIPAYRLSQNSRVPDLHLGTLWRRHLVRELNEHSGVIVDLRSESYAALGPAPARLNSAFVRVVTRTADGRVRAISHANKHTKGAFTRDLLLRERAPETVDDLVATAADMGWMLTPSDKPASAGRRVLDLVI